MIKQYNVSYLPLLLPLEHTRTLKLDISKSVLNSVGTEDSPPEEKTRVKKIKRKGENCRTPDKDDEQKT